MRTIDNINDLNKSDFLSVFGNVFEKTESVALEAFDSKPFKNFEDIMFKMLDIYENYEKNKILEILNAHPELAVAKKMTSESITEQASAKLNQCSNDEYEEFKKLYIAYKKKFNFPFIIAVKGKDKNEIPSKIRITPTKGKSGEHIGYCGITTLLADKTPDEVRPKISFFTKIFKWMVIMRLPFLSATFVPEVRLGPRCSTQGLCIRGRVVTARRD